MQDELPRKNKTLLAVALAQGTRVAAWACSAGVPKRTALRWAREPGVRAKVNACRRRAIDRAVGQMVKRSAWAADRIAKLGQNAESESVRLPRCERCCLT